VEEEEEEEAEEDAVERMKTEISENYESDLNLVTSAVVSGSVTHSHLSGVNFCFNFDSLLCFLTTEILKR